MTEQKQPAIPTAQVSRLVAQKCGSAALELLVNIEGRDLPILLPVDALPNLAPTDQAEAETLEKIADNLEAIREWIENLTNSIPNHDDLNSYVDRLGDVLLQKQG
ncbi:MAG: hypothetical protein OXJ64_19915 [Boseongicola sp.]|nr:hypothetical protein [Boseongicola sp.]